ncbi:photosynthetic protein synthase I [Photobacterium iliopiscarium]|uniref:SCO family protein n=1 Tax=Photobacterium iliopiscarium TaxID=56192 RepID=A0A0D8P931_9GAMM|nr:SCO family protein [Photobacterium iliopiscarium]KJG13549.1 photosynthetic protein synthase I [Photobacterium iliopiscarium]KJG22679.1 photosynthetic protein synthase I [Photobacterium iliopiscarium]PST99559.1 SCO family protein [Photobacterium iliopiscarium]PSV82884.1 SCO family protein [Photobacterium iliopiscarium]PSV97057.1 SCO family protein [Photobacterium iliopiscarium]
MKYQWLVIALALAAGLFARYIMDSNDPEVTREPYYPMNYLESGTEVIDLFAPEDNRIRLVYFGYTQCPDICPTSLAVLSAALKAIPQQQRDKLWPIFISLDPARDTADKTAQYTAYFDAEITGATGTEQQIKALADTYGVLYIKNELKNSEIKYVIDHNSYFYFLKPTGELIKKLPHMASPAQLIATIPIIISATTK